MGSPDRLFRIYQNAQPASLDQIRRVLYGSPTSEAKPSHKTDSEPSPRELANGNIGGRRAERIRSGDDGKSRSEGRRKSRDIDSRPRAGIVFTYPGEEIREGEFLAPTGTEGKSLGNCRRGRANQDRGGISHQSHPRR